MSLATLKLSCTILEISIFNVADNDIALDARCSGYKSCVSPAKVLFFKKIQTFLSTVRYVTAILSVVARGTFKLSSSQVRLL